MMKRKITVISTKGINRHSDISSVLCLACLFIDIIVEANNIWIWQNMMENHHNQNWLSNCQC